MTKDEIIRMARVAGFEQGLIRFGADAESIEFFAAIIAAAEREACAKVCDEQAKSMWGVVAEQCAETIRARGQ